MALFRPNVGKYVVLTPPAAPILEFPADLRHLANRRHGVAIVQADAKKLLQADEGEIKAAVTPLVNLLLSVFGTMDVFEPGRPIVENAASWGYALGTLENADPRGREGLTEPHYKTVRTIWKNIVYKSAYDSVGAPICFVADYAFDAAYWCSRSGADPTSLKDGFLQFVRALNEQEHETTVGRTSR